MQAQNTLDATIAAAGSKATYTGAWTTVAGYILSSEFAALCGIVLGLAGFMVNIWFRRREDERQRREEERRKVEHEARMRAIAK